MPITFDRFVEVALYEPEVGFFASGPRRGPRRRATSSRVPKSARCSARASRARSTGAGTSSASPTRSSWSKRARATAGSPATCCAPHPRADRALHYVLVEVSAALRDEQRERLDLEPPDEALGPFRGRAWRRRAAVPVAGSGPVVVALDELPALELTGVVLANELLDNLPFGIAECDRHRRGRRCASRSTPAGGFAEVLVPAEPDDADALDAVTDGLAVAAGARLPIPRGIDAWFASCAADAAARDADRDRLRRRRARRARTGRAPSWLRTYREPRARRLAARRARRVRHHRRRRARAAPARGPAGRDSRSSAEQSQAEWLRDLGIDELAEEGRRTWEARAHIGDLEALAGRSRVGEASALTDPGRPRRPPGRDARARDRLGSLRRVSPR